MTAIMIYHIRSKYTAVGQYLFPCQFRFRLLHGGSSLSAMSSGLLLCTFHLVKRMIVMVLLIQL